MLIGLRSTIVLPPTLSTDGYIMIWQLDDSSSSSSATSAPPAITADTPLFGDPSPATSSSSSSASASSLPVIGNADDHADDASMSPFDDDEHFEQRETWVCRQRLRAHSADVYDLSWSADSLAFISGAVDRSAFVWRRDTNGQRCMLFILSLLSTSPW